MARMPVPDRPTSAHRSRTVRRVTGIVVAAALLAGCADRPPELADAAAPGAATSQPGEGVLDLDTGTAVIAGETVQAAPVAGDHFVGEVTEQLRIAVAVDGAAVTVYLCDDDRGVWLRGELVDGRVQLVDDEAGASVELELTGGGAAGTATLDGVTTEQAFAAEPAQGDDGLYRAEVTVEQVDYVGGWVVLQAVAVGAITL